MEITSTNADLREDGESAFQDCMAEEIRGKSTLCTFFANFLNTTVPVGDGAYIERLMASLENLESASGAIPHNAFAEARNEVAADAAKAQERLAVERTRYVLGLRVNNAVKPPFESLYLTPNDALDEIASVAGAYRQAGFQLLPEANNRPDSLACELAFLAQLFQEQAQALEVDDGQTAHSRQQSAANFTTNHLGKWAPDFCEHAAAETDSAVFRLMMLLMQAFIEEELGGIDCRKVVSGIRERNLDRTSKRKGRRS